MKKRVREYCLGCNTNVKLRLPIGKASRVYCPTCGSCLGYCDGIRFVSRFFLKDAYVDPSVVILANYMTQEGCDATYTAAYEFDLRDYDEMYHLNLVNDASRRKTLLYHIGKDPRVIEVYMVDDTRLTITYYTGYCQNYKEE